MDRKYLLNFLCMIGDIHEQIFPFDCPDSYSICHILQDVKVSFVYLIIDLLYYGFAMALLRV